MTQACPIKLPTGEVFPITHIGTVRLSHGLTLDDVHYFPDFQFNLLSISKITNVLNFFALFFSSICVFQDLSTKRLIGMGEVRDGLYYYRPLHPLLHKALPSDLACDPSLWHHQLRDPSIFCLNKTINISSSKFHCDVCVRAKQPRLPFKSIPIKALVFLIEFIVIFGVDSQLPLPLVPIIF